MNKKQTDISVRQRRYEATQHLDSTTGKHSQAHAGSLICTQCRAVHHDKHWYTEDESFKYGVPADYIETLCPGCSMLEKKVWEGTVELLGKFDSARLKEMKHLIDNVESECWRDNPASRVLSMTEADSRIEIKTTTIWLAQRIGKMLERAYGGNLEVNTSPEKPSVYVRWSEE